MSHMRMSHVTHENESCHTCKWGVPQMGMTHVTSHNETWLQLKFHRVIKSCFIVWRDVRHSCVWCDSFICVTWLIHLCDVTHSFVWRDSFICATWLVHMCDMTNSYVWHDVMYVIHDSFACAHLFTCAHLLVLIYMCSFTCAKFTCAHLHLLIHICSFTFAHLHVLIHMCSFTCAHLHLLIYLCSFTCAHSHVLIYMCSFTCAHLHVRNDSLWTTYVPSHNETWLEFAILLLLEFWLELDMGWLWFVGSFKI